MARYRALEKAEAEIAEGKLGIARDRLNGLVTSSPGDMSLRSRLGDVYAKLGYPVEAGRFWFFDEDLDEEKREAIGAFVKSCDGRPDLILRRLKLRRSVWQPLSGSVEEKIRELIEDCQSRGVEPPADRRSEGVARDLNWKPLAIGCVTLIGAILVLALVGLVALLTGERMR